MCGIAGQLIKKSNSFDIGKATADMIATLKHRGPDDSGIWQDDTAGVCLGHRRLSILDLTSDGHQPMCSSNGRYVLVFNGEIYNFKELRDELEHSGRLQNAGESGALWRGHSDTEVMLAAISCWGVNEATKRFSGMFAFALWDREEKRLYLVRDRVGEKPLYFGWVGETLLFGSELKALRAHPKWQGEIDRNALALYMQFNYIPAPYTIYKGIRKLEAGCIAEIPGKGPGQDYDVIRYWSLDNAVDQPRKEFSDISAIEQVESILSASVKRQMVSDVPLGAFLSGGIDSSLIVALMQKQSSSPVKTFTIGFNETSYNEAEHAAAVAHHLGTEHTEFYVTAKDAMDIIPSLPNLYDEPFADSSQIPTHLVSKLTRSHVTVSLSGDGGDEFFGGYNRYSWGSNIWNRIKCFPLPIRRAIANLIRFPSPRAWDNLFSVFNSLLPSRFRYGSAGDKLHKLAKLVGAISASDVFLELISLWKGTDIVIGSESVVTTVTNPKEWPKNINFAESMMYMDARTYLTDDILVKVDRASMGASLESRAPFLDREVMEFAWTLPLNMKIRNGQGKWLLRQVLDKHVPRSMIERPKMGFGIPIDSWLRGPLREWAENLLAESTLRSYGYMEVEPIRQKWDEHISGKRNWQYELWNVLMFQAWLEK